MGSTQKGTFRGGYGKGMTRGIVMHAYNNDQVDYSLIALCNAMMIKSNLDVPVSLITNSTDWLYQSQGALVDKAFDQIIIKNDLAQTLHRRFNDTPHTAFSLPWHNSTRADTYTLSPYDETILIDCDYLIMDRTLNLLWGSVHDLMISKDALPLNHGELKSSEKWIADTSIRMYWATCVYFKKSPMAETFFDLVNHVKTHYEYYGMVYGFPVTLFRNDYAFSIAAHMLNGFIPNGEEVASLPFPLFTSFDTDDLIDVEKNEMTFLISDSKEHWKFNLTKTKGINVHCMNKFAIIRQAEKLKGIYNV